MQTHGGGTIDSEDAPTAAHEKDSQPADAGRSGLDARRVGTTFGLLALVVSALYGGNFFGVRTAVLDLPTPERPATSRFAETEPATGATAAPGPSGTATPEATLLRSQPWWQGVETFEGRGETSLPAFTIADSALQWRVDYTCQSGSLTVTAPGRDEPLIEADCDQGGEGTGYSTQTGQTSLQVDATGPWQLEVGQQVDVPLQESPTEAMQAPGTEQILTGGFYDIDQSGRGQVRIYRLANGRYALRLDGFFVTPNVDLEVRLSPLERPQTTPAFRSAPSVIAAGLDATAGSMNFMIPEGIDPTDYESVVIWCPPVLSAYAAAPLSPPQ